MNSIEQKVCATIRRYELAQRQTPVLLMVSGGSDSTALAYIMSKLREEGIVGSVVILHVNHQLRGEAADGDARFVAHLSDLLHIPLFSVEIDIAKLVQDTGENEEAIARQERYVAANEALESLCYHESCPLSDGRIFTAHTADDRVENFYMRSIVGTGPGGFRSMKYLNGLVARPLLDLGRSDLESYIQKRDANGEACVRDETGSLWRLDATNAHTDKFRAYVRHKIVPLAKARNENLLETLSRTMNLIADEDDMLEDRVDDLVEECVSWVSSFDEYGPDYSLGCVLSPSLGKKPLPLQRRLCVRVLGQILGPDARVETATIEAILHAYNEEGKPISAYVTNIQGNLAVSANKQGVRIEPMEAYRRRRKRY
ncbi:MAG: tRNA lysidine(34) synthetase TilS [Eggerthellaceae bacterium]|jgi:tRNA(Ile)-lysidine synthase